MHAPSETSKAASDAAAAPADDATQAAAAADESDIFGDDDIATPQPSFEDGASKPKKSVTIIEEVPVGSAAATKPATEGDLDDLD